MTQGRRTIAPSSQQSRAACMYENENVVFQSPPMSLNDLQRRALYYERLDANKLQSNTNGAMLYQTPVWKNSSISDEQLRLRLLSVIDEALQIFETNDL